ncbi:hypothetical protein, partial [Ralstonia solanacearum]|uniref:hypothetical protein n=1 Tax=Ralstonia solanacearum TaxID=305 RepID=UPI001E4128D9
GFAPDKFCKVYPASCHPHMHSPGKMSAPAAETPIRKGRPDWLHCARPGRKLADQGCPRRAMAVMHPSCGPTITIGGTLRPSCNNS